MNAQLDQNHDNDETTAKSKVNLYMYLDNFIVARKKCIIEFST